MAAAAGNGAATVRRLADDRDWDRSPDYTPAEWPMPMAAGAVGEVGRAAPGTDSPAAGPDWMRPLDPLGTVLVPPTARPARSAVEPRVEAAALVAAAMPADRTMPPTPPELLLPPMPAAAPAVGRPPQPQPQPQANGTAAPAPRRRFAGLGGGGGWEQEQLAAIRTPLSRSYRVAVIGLAHGVGKTTTTLGLGWMLASERSGGVVAIDADPGTGSLGRRAGHRNPATVRDLVEAAAPLAGRHDVRRFTSQTPHGLDLLAHPVGPASAFSPALDAGAYRQAVQLAGDQYPVTLADCGAGLPTEALRGVLDVVDQVVVAAGTTVDGARGALATLEWLTAHGYGELAQRAIMAVCPARSAGRRIRPEDMAPYFRARCRDVVVVPPDEHLAGEGGFDPAELRPRTRKAFRTLAALVGEDMRRVERAGAGSQ